MSLNKQIFTASFPKKSFFHTRLLWRVCNQPIKAFFSLCLALTINKQAFFLNMWCTWEIWRALREARVAQRVTLLSLLSYSTNFQCASITQYTLAKHEHLKNMIPVKSQETGARKTKSSGVA